MKGFIKTISLLLCVCMLFSACKNDSVVEEQSTNPESVVNDGEEAKMGDGKITLPYNPDDGLNPYFAESDENLYLCKLLYEPLFKVNGDFSVEGVIAESINMTDNIASVRLRHSVNCHGSSEITAEDVVYSFNMARASHGWKNALSGIVSAQAVGQYAVDFTLEYKDIYTSGKLDFPIVKAGTADSQTTVPTGSGDYYYAQKKLVNVLNPDKTIYLSTTGTRESAKNAVNIGVTDVFFSDLSDCDYTVSAGTSRDVQLNNMVYLGLNSTRGALTNYIRSAIAAKIDCDRIALSAYQGHATAAKLPINPESISVGEIDWINTVGDKTLADNIIDRCGYTRYSGKAKTNGAYTLSLSLIVNKDNKFRVTAAYNVADSLAECGFLVRVQTLSYKEYAQRISDGNYDMYIGEIRLDGSMDISQFFLEGTAVGTGINKSDPAAEAYFRYRAGELTAKEYYTIFSEEYPFVPLVFRKGYVVTSDDVNPGLKQMPYDLYNGI